MHHQYVKDEENADIVSVYCELGRKSAASEKFDEACDLIEKGLQMSFDIRGLGCVHTNVATSMSELIEL